MSEALISDHRSLTWEATKLLPSGKACDWRRSASAVEAPALPIVQPGQLWFVELPSAGPALSPLEYRALTTANVVIYDRVLAQTVARFLPLGGYAEPAAPSDGVHDAAAERCLHFARDGWSVARLIVPGVLSERERVEKIRRLSARVLNSEGPVDRQVLVFANAGAGRYAKGAAELDELAEIVETGGVEQSPTLTIVFDAIDTAPTPHFLVASANGLAG
jgi:hypothetical protein